MRAGRALALGIGILVALLCAATASADEAIPGRYIVVLENSVAHPGAVAAAHEGEYRTESDGIYRDALNGYVADVPRGELAELRSDPKVEFVAQDRVFARLPSSSREVVRCKDVPTVVGALDHLQCLPDGIDRIDADRSSARSGDGRDKENVNVAIIDSGIDIDHPDLNVAGGVDCTSGTPIADPALYDDYFGHGTFVGGVAGAKDNRRGVVGVAPGTPLWSARVVADDGEITESGLICAVDWATSTRTDRNKKNDIAVANMSISSESGDGLDDDGNCGRSNDDPLHLAYCRSVRAGVTHVAAAGNDAVDLAQQVPAAYNEVITATAMADLDGKPGGEGPTDCYGFEWFESDDRGASFSNFAILDDDKPHTIAAPGVCIDSTVPDGYTAGDGTSFSAPHVAGIAALCIASGRCSGGAKQVMQKLLHQAKAYNLAHPDYGFLGDPLDPIGPEYYGYLINAGIY